MKRERSLQERLKKVYYDVYPLRVLRALSVLIREKRTLRKYFRLGMEKNIRRHKEKYEGKRCFIIGNGPSLRVDDLERLKNEYTFASNRIYEIFRQTNWRPWSYLVIDSKFVQTNQKEIYDSSLENKFLSFEGYSKKYAGGGVNWIYERPHLHIKDIINPGGETTAYIPDDVSVGFSRGHTVTFTAIQLAIYMGFREIYLLGVDFNYSVVRDAEGKIHYQDDVKDYFDGRRYDTTLMDFVPTLHAYTVAKEYCDTHNIVIRNATRGGKLEVFERVDFDSLFANRHEQTCSEKRNK